MYKLCVESEFSAAHFLNEYDGPCKRIHGHNWKVKVVVTTLNLTEQGMTMDLMILKKVVDECTAQFDHRLLNEVSPFDSVNPTLENMSRIIFEWIEKKLPPKVSLSSVQVFETDKYSVTYSPD